MQYLGGKKRFGASPKVDFPLFSAQALTLPAGNKESWGNSSHFVYRCSQSPTN